MKFKDIFLFSSFSIVSQKMRSFLTALGIGVGVLCVIFLTSMGQGLQDFIVGQFTQFGSNIIAVQPGKTQTLGAPMGIHGTMRPLSFGDAEAIEKLPLVEYSVPVSGANGEIENDTRLRRSLVVGTGADYDKIVGADTMLGQYLPKDNAKTPRSFVVLGPKMRDELFGNENPLGKAIRVNSQRFRIVGVLPPKGDFLGFDLDDAVYIPIAKFNTMFNKNGFQEIDVVHYDDATTEEVVASVKRLMISRHGGEDVTITTQADMLDSLGEIMKWLKFTVAAFGGISLLVGGVGIFTIMTVAVNERKSEIGILRAIGASQNRIRDVFLLESIFLSIFGAILGLLAGFLVINIALFIYPDLPIAIAWEYILYAVLISLFIGLLAGFLPARSASEMDPIEALRSD
ncbi:MAG: ABC transporter permease [Gammaproteobacteria bacterium]|jgi:putative ABC transport system permease protein|nr:peptide ABC transporter permease [Gammaproteobacteria bacterium]MBQ09715.1 peptide ABC transporter permease [Gammaproteobacteria bacterium]MDP6147072.1 ABC transporter permease [Gammaproteobacteria bacterium]HJL79574.1 ABC transporter permease [Gammaproteobacteria bacterium]HJM09719.1 ABC transporter permease [Gammaproteobacteria bacterium]|tara:strand:+ start:6216 stop:7415 length:1200 start_codon:yes stop_codon:yes gene_type:complete